jgi:hypothetical protein
MNILLLIWSWLVAVWHHVFGDGLYRGLYVDDAPEVLQRRAVYLVGDGTYLWSAVMRCPCGCGKRLEMNLLTTVEPVWKLNEGRKGELTLHPSIWLKTGCKAHFFLRGGKIQWA